LRKTISHPRGGKGLFITFEGPEGCGKSTHARLLFNHLRKKGYRCVFTREPGGTPVGDEIRKILLKKKALDINSLCELFLFEASRAQIVSEVISPALKKRKIVICDRFYDATVVYQGFAGGMDIGLIDRLNREATGGLKPKVTILLDIETKKGFKRALKNRRPDRMESKSLAFHRKVRSGYLKLAMKYPGRIKVFKADGEIRDVQKAIREYVIGCLSRI